MPERRPRPHIVLGNIVARRRIPYLIENNESKRRSKRRLDKRRIARKKAHDQYAVKNNTLEHPSHRRKWHLDNEGAISVRKERARKNGRFVRFKGGRT
mmetsp:Transcript_36713/g.78225  ORF Transcript_36713/g.78225 Transcript_36713/m.78225 type:complete len:98 (+) Transcript_36713:305-598(+)